MLGAQYFKMTGNRKGRGLSSSPLRTVYYIVTELFRCIKKNSIFVFLHFFFFPSSFSYIFREPNIGKKIGMDDLEFWVQGKKRMMKGILLRKLESETCSGDFLDQVIKDMETGKFLTEDFVVNLLFGLLFADSISSVTTLIFKFLLDHLTALEELRVILPSYLPFFLPNH